MGDDSFDGLVVFHHLLVMAAALFMGTAADGLAHHAVEVPLPSVLFAPLDHGFEFHEETDILLVLFLTPMALGILFARSCLGVIQTINHLLGPEDPGLDLVPRNCSISSLVRFGFRRLSEGKHGNHFEL